MKTFAALLSATPILGLAVASATSTRQAPATPDPSARFRTALRNDDLAALRGLVHEYGAKTADDAGNTPLMAAAMVGSVDGMKILLDAGESPNEANKTDVTPLILCAGDARKAKLLLGRGADPRARAQSGRSALEVAAFSNAETVRMLLARGADPKAKDAGGATALQIAAGQNDLSAVRLLLAHGADPNAADATGFTPLMASALSGEGSEAVTRLLIDHGANVNARSGDVLGMVPRGKLELGRLTALHLAAQSDARTVRALLAAGADPKAKDIRGATPLVFAVATDHPKIDIVRTLRARVDDPMATEWATRYNDARVLAALGRKPVVSASTEADAATPELRAALASALATSQRTSAGFMKAGGCFACHAQIATGVAVWHAKSAGAKTDEATEAGMIAGELGGAAYFANDVAQMIDPGGSFDTAASGLGHLASAGAPATPATDAFVHYILASQRKEGDWPIPGVVRPPLQDGSFGGTARCLRALRAFAIPARKAEFEASIARGAKWLATHVPTTTEDRTMQIRGLLWAGQKAPANRVEELARLQRPDGGWGQTSGLPSDAYATGEALVALREAGMKIDALAYRRGVDFLLHTQRPDGTWHVVSRALKFQPYFESGFPYGPDQWISQAGTAYATMALADAARRE